VYHTQIFKNHLHKWMVKHHCDTVSDTRFSWQYVIILRYIVWDDRPYSLVDGYQENGDNRYPQNVSTYLHNVQCHIPNSQSSLSKCLDVFKQQKRRHCNTGIYHLQVRQELEVHTMLNIVHVVSVPQIKSDRRAMDTEVKHKVIINLHQCVTTVI
jgi:hypothetical protein